MVYSGQLTIPAVGDVQARGQVGRCHWHAGQGPDDSQSEFQFSLDTNGVRWPAHGFFTIPTTVPHAEHLVRLVKTAAEHGWLVVIAARQRAGSHVYDVYDLYTEF